MALPVVAVVAAATLAGSVGYGAYLWQSQRDGESLPQVALPGQVGPGITKPLPPAVDDFDIEDFIGLFPNGGIHETRENNSISAVARGVLNKIDPGAGNDPTMVRAYKRILNSSEWNRRLYGVYNPNVDDNFEGYHIERAFLPYHEDAAGVLRAGIMPDRMISTSGVPLPASPRKWGDIWAVRLEPAAVRARITDPSLLVAHNEDGSSGLNPPSVLVAKLKVRAA